MLCRIDSSAFIGFSVLRHAQQSETKKKYKQNKPSIVEAENRDKIDSEMRHTTLPTP